MKINTMYKIMLYMVMLILAWILLLLLLVGWYYKFKPPETMIANNAEEKKHISLDFKNFEHPVMPSNIPEDKENTKEKPEEPEEPEPEPIVINMEATYYTAECTGCIGITKTGIDVRDTIYHDGERIIAVDPDIIELGTRVLVTTDNNESFIAKAEDVGRDIKGNRIDILVETKAEAIKLGRVNARVEIIEEG